MQDENIRDILERCYDSRSLDENDQAYYRIDEASLKNLQNLLLAVQECFREKDKELEDAKRIIGWMFVTIVLLIGLLIGILVF